MPKGRIRKTVNRPVSFEVEDLERMGNHVDFSQFGQFSQFVRIACKNEMDRREGNPLSYTHAQAFAQVQPQQQQQKAS